MPNFKLIAYKYALYYRELEKKSKSRKDRSFVKDFFSSKRHMHSFSMSAKPLQSIANKLSEELIIQAQFVIEVAIYPRSGLFEN